MKNAVVAKLITNGERDGRLLTRDMVSFVLTDLGRSIFPNSSVSSDAGNKIRSIKIEIESINATITLVSDTNCKNIKDLLESLGDKIKKADIKFFKMKSGKNQWSIKFPLTSITAILALPFCKGANNDKC